MAGKVCKSFQAQMKLRSIHQMCPHRRTQTPLPDKASTRSHCHRQQVSSPAACRLLQSLTDAVSDQLTENLELLLTEENIRPCASLLEVWLLRVCLWTTVPEQFLDLFLDLTRGTGWPCACQSADSPADLHRVRRQTCPRQPGIHIAVWRKSDLPMQKVAMRIPMQLSEPALRARGLPVLHK